MRTGTVQEGIREIRTCINLSFWPCSKIMERSSPRDQTSDYGWQGSFGGAWFYVVAEHGDSRISGFGDPERFENFHFQCLGSEIHVSTDLQCYQLINYVQLRQHSQRWRELCTSFRF